MDTSFQTNSIAICQLKKAVEARFGHVPSGPADFGELSIAILRATGERLSPDTLSRIWGYKKGYSSVRQSTVRVLEQYAKANEESDFLGGSRQQQTASWRHLLLPHDSARRRIDSGPCRNR